LLADMVAGLGVGVNLALAVAQVARVACRRRAVLQVFGDRYLALFLDLVHCLEIGPGAVGLGGGRQVKRRLDDRIDALRQACYSIHSIMSSSVPACRLTGSQWAWPA